MPLPLISSCMATVFSASTTGTLPTTSMVGSSTSAVPGSSDGCCGNTPLPAPAPLKKPWLEITVPLTAVMLTTTSKVMVATLLAAASVSARKKPAVVSSGALINMPEASGDTPLSGWPTGRPFKVTVSATYVVLAGI